MTFVLGIIDIIDNYYRNFVFGIGHIKFNPIFLVLFIFFLVLSKDRLSALFPEKEFSEQKKSEIKAEKEKFEAEPTHFCEQCGATDKSQPDFDFRYRDES